MGDVMFAVTTVVRPLRNVPLTGKEPQSVLDCSKLQVVMWHTGTALLSCVE